MALNSFQDFQNFITKVLTDNGDIDKVAAAPHDAFWQQMTYDEFVNGDVPNVTDDNNQPIKILVKGNSAQSNLIKILNGPLGTIPRMPKRGTAFTPVQIKELADWIDANCPNPAH